jgi:hypothetical protein
MTLRGVYDNGTITLLDKNLPKIKTEVESFYTKMSL